MEELEQALREFGMNDAKDIKEIISEVDSDNVSQIYIHFQKYSTKFLLRNYI